MDGLGVLGFPAGLGFGEDNGDGGFSYVLVDSIGGTEMLGWSLGLRVWKFGMGGFWILAKRWTTNWDRGRAMDGCRLEAVKGTLNGSRTMGI